MRGWRAAASLPVARLLWCCAALLPPRGASGTRLGAAAGSLRRAAAGRRGGAASAEARAERGPNFPDVENFELPTCDCTCCMVLERKFDEVHESTGALLKCGLDEAGPGHPVVKRVPSGSAGQMAASDFLCPGSAGAGGAAWHEARRCRQDSGIHAQASAAVLARPGPAGTDYNRFCLFQCRPRDFSVGEPCLPIDFEAANASMTAHGNGRDPGLQPLTPGAGPLPVPPGAAFRADALAVAPEQPGVAMLQHAGAALLEELPRTLMAILEQRLSELLDQEIQQFPWLTGSC